MEDIVPWSRGEWEEEEILQAILPLAFGHGIVVILGETKSPSLKLGEVQHELTSN